MEPFRMTRKILILLFWALLWQAASMMVGNSFYTSYSTVIIWL